MNQLLIDSSVNLSQQMVSQLNILECVQIFVLLHFSGMNTVYIELFKAFYVSVIFNVESLLNSVLLIST